MAVQKKHVTRWRRSQRFISSISTPKAWVHLLKLINFYNYAHVQPMRWLQRGSDCAISPTATFSYGERITIGARVLIGEDCRLWAGPSEGRVIIGDDAMLGPGVLITAASYRFNDGAPIRRQIVNEADVVIGSDVWIGARVTILPGTVIGDGCVVGAGSVVRDSTPPMNVIAGVPARIVGQRILHSDIRLESIS